MVDLRACFEELGFDHVTTYIQSGNVLFSSNESSATKLNSRIEKALAGRFGYEANVVLRSQRQLAGVIKSAPKGFGANPARYRYDVIFLKEPLTASFVMKHVLTKPEVDQAHPGIGVLYFSRRISRISQSRLSRIASMPIYQRITIRNWNTTTALAQSMEPGGDS